MAETKILKESIEKNDAIDYKNKNLDLKAIEVFFTPEAIKYASEQLEEFSENNIKPGDFIAGLPINNLTAILYFNSRLSEYKDWYWYVIITSKKDEKQKISYNVNEAGMVAGKDAVIAPKWVPWIRRIKDGQVNTFDILPYDSDDPRLIKNLYFAVDKRKRTLSQKGLLETVARWNAGPNGDNSASSKISSQYCKTCGFYCPLGRKFSGEFGVCANGVTIYDGKVVSSKHGCGAHSETDINFDLREK